MYGDGRWCVGEKKKMKRDGAKQPIGLPGGTEMFHAKWVRILGRVGLHVAVPLLLLPPSIQPNLFLFFSLFRVGNAYGMLTIISEGEVETTIGLSFLPNDAPVPQRIQNLPALGNAGECRRCNGNGAWPVESGVGLCMPVGWLGGRSDKGAKSGSVSRTDYLWTFSPCIVRPFSLFLSLHHKPPSMGIPYFVKLLNLDNPPNQITTFPNPPSRQIERTT